MRRIRWTLAIALAITTSSGASAQFFPPPIVPVVGVPVLVPNGVGFNYSGRRLNVNGFWGNGTYTPGMLPIAATGGMPLVPGQQIYLYTPGYFPQMYSPYSSYPFGVQTSGITVHIINPPAVNGFRRNLADDFDINGIDLDTEPAARIWNRNAPQPKVMKAAQKELEERKAEAAKPPAPAERKAEAVVANAPEAAKPKAEVIPAWQRLMDLGTKSFRGGEYGLAMLRFRQAGSDRARALFLEAQACVAVGKYHEAVELIQQGLQRDPAWPQNDFRPKTELYDNDAARWKQHLTRLEEAQRKAPKDADRLFLLGYLAWFDGNRDAAVAHLQQARALADDPRWVDLFLKADGK